MDRTTEILIVATVGAVFLGLAYMIFFYKPKKKSVPPKSGSGGSADGNIPSDYQE